MQRLRIPVLGDGQPGSFANAPAISRRSKARQVVDCLPATSKNGGKLKEDIRMRYNLGVVVMFLILASAVPALADNFFGKMTLVQVSTLGTRFFVQPKGLSLFATGEYRDVLLEALSHKANVSVGYTKIACPGGITGTCGNVNFVTFDNP
jgi:hypothetical protein